MAESWQVLEGNAWEVAPRLLGSLLVREIDGNKLIGKIVETEAYDQTDAASHSYHGRTPRTDVMFGTAGHLYVYLSYGMHYCCNVVTGSSGHGSAVLIRAVEPMEGVAVMRANRHGVPDLQLTNGPGKVCQAFGIDASLNGHNLQLPPLQLVLQPPVPQDQIAQTARVGITKAVDVPWRFYLKGSPVVTRIT